MLDDNTVRSPQTCKLHQLSHDHLHQQLLYEHTYSVWQKDRGRVCPRWCQLSLLLPTRLSSAQSFSEASNTAGGRRCHIHVLETNKYVSLPIFNDPAKFLHAFRHLGHGSCAIHQLATVWVCKLVGCHERQHAHCFTSTSGHFQHPISMCIEDSLRVYTEKNKRSSTWYEKRLGPDCK